MKCEKLLQAGALAFARALQAHSISQKHGFEKTIDSDPDKHDTKLPSLRRRVEP